MRNGQFWCTRHSSAAGLSQCCTAFTAGPIPLQPSEAASCACSVGMFPASPCPSCNILISLFQPSRDCQQQHLEQPWPRVSSSSLCFGADSGVGKAGVGGNATGCSNRCRVLRSFKLVCACLLIVTFDSTEYRKCSLQAFVCLRLFELESCVSLL